MPGRHSTTCSATFTLILALAGSLRAQTSDAPKELNAYALSSWTQANGFYFGDTQAITQDATGYLWLGTSVGLIRFDGVEFAQWDAGVVPLNTVVNALTASRDGSLWVGLAGRIVRVREGRSTMYTSLDGFGGGGLVAIVEDRNGVIWTSGTGGVWRFRDDRWEHVGSRHGLSERASWGLFVDPRGALWVATGEGIFVRNPDADRFEQVTQSSIVIRSLASDTAGALWATDPDHTLTVVGHRQQLRGWLGGAFGAGTALLRDRYGNLWVGTRGQGVLRVPPVSNPVLTEISHIKQGDGLATNAVHALFEDREGNIWIGMTGGLARLAEKSVETVARGETVSAITTTRDGSVWIGTDSGLIRLIEGRQVRYGVRDGLPSAAILALHTGDDDGLWVATNRGPARLIAGRFVALTVPDGVHLQRIRSLMTDRDGTLWMGDFDYGLFRLAGGTMAPFTALSHVPVTAAHADRSGRVWLGQFQGEIAAYSQGRIERYSTDESRLTGAINTIYEDSHGVVWLGSMTGLSRLQDDRVVNIDNQHLSTGVLAIVEDPDHYLWIATRAGIVRARAAELASLPANSMTAADYDVIDAADGLPGVPVRAVPGAVRAADGSLWFATTNGVARVVPQRLRESTSASMIRIGAVIADDRVLRAAKQMSFPPGTARIAIQYALSTLNPPPATRFMYRLDGYDNDWVRAGTRREALYTNLPPGRYRFYVTTGEVVGSFGQAAWDFSIEPRFYQTGAFVVVSLAGLVLLVSAAWRLRLVRLKRQYNMVLSERTRIAREMHDTLLQGLASVAVQLDGISQQLDSPPERTQKRIENVRQMVSRYIRETRSFIWLIRSPALEERDLPSVIRETAETLTAGMPIRFKFDVIGRVTQLPGTIEQELLRIVNEAIINVLKHAKATELHVAMQYGMNVVQIRISDNGCGFDVEKLTTDAKRGLGILGLKERAKEIDATFQLSSVVGHGTQIELAVPFSPDSPTYQ